MIAPRDVSGLEALKTLVKSGRAFVIDEKPQMLLQSPHVGMVLLIVKIATLWKRKPQP
jgi:hypothetical protein